MVPWPPEMGKPFTADVYFAKQNVKMIMMLTNNMNFQINP